MTDPVDKPSPSQVPNAQELGESLAAQIGAQEWVLDQADLLMDDEFLNKADPTLVPESASEEIGEAEQPAIPIAQAAIEPEVPPSPLQIIEAMLFIGGQPLKAERACEIIRGLGVEQVREAIEILDRVYRMQNRPYIVSSSEQGYVLSLRTRYRSIKEKIFGGPREARLAQPALDVLALVAYRQPAPKNEIDTIRGNESGPILRQLVRLGLISVVQRAEAAQREVSYGTTQRFLELFNLKNLDDLPRIGDARRL
jgi:segregation and condensation protein B